MVVPHHQQHRREFGVHPAITRPQANAVTQPQPDPQRQRRHGQDGGEAQQLACHQQQPLPLGQGAGCHHRQVHKNTRQVEQTSKPAGDKNDVEGFDPEHGQSLRRPPARTHSQGAPVHKQA